MAIPEGLEAVAISALVFVALLFLVALQRGSLSERQQTCAWLCFTALFLALCGVAVHGRGPLEINAPEPLDLASAARTR